ncbi:hypothetical protein [Sphingomonas oligophenolica]|uniref:Colicin transporter n=1 Tax=Sphingomonas oligophenolica TaxID=301154 RepID=A0A502CKG5_9SPHN|nr:hypothetical protein [Sphingomonas oligophenolica]TPG13104.1 hypothetical protein EAH84_06765 [Sphingomonas oligophenolica]
MTAAYRLKGVGWFGGCVAIVLGFYLVSLQVAAERKKLDGVNGRIEAAQRDIRALETEFETRANLAQLEKWNGDTLALASPTAGQFLPDEAALAAFDVNQVGATIQTAALVVPSLPTALPAVPTTRAAAAAAPAVAQVASAIRTAEKTVIRPAPVAKSAPMLAKLTDTARAAVAVAKVRPEAVAMLDRKLLSDDTLGTILRSARAESHLR